MSFCSFVPAGRGEGEGGVGGQEASVEIANP